MVSFTPRPLFSRGVLQVPIGQEIWWAPEQFWTKIFSFVGNRTPVVQPVDCYYPDSYNYSQGLITKLTF